MGNWYDTIQMSQISHRLWVGGKKAASDLVGYNPAGITAVLNVNQAPDEKQSHDIIYMHIPFDDGEAIPPKQFVKCLGWLKFMYENGHTILIHCAAGISRSVTITAAFMHYEGITDFNSALNQIRLARPVASPAPAVVVSAKKLLGVYPYDGSMVPDHEKTVGEVIERVQNQRAAYAHPNEDCPMRVFLLEQTESNQPRHEIPCTCPVFSAEQQVVLIEEEPSDKKIVIIEGEGIE
jgi:protein-tyrosine phosphatase